MNSFLANLPGHEINLANFPGHEIFCHFKNPLWPGVTVKGHYALSNHEISVPFRRKFRRKFGEKYANLANIEQKFRKLTHEISVENN